MVCPILRLDYIVTPIQHPLRLASSLPYCLDMALGSGHVVFEERFVESLLLDEANVKHTEYAAGRELLLSYSHLPEETLPSHVVEIVRKIRETLYYGLC